jgi:hypothetical protein
MPVVGRLDQFGSMIVTGEFDEVNYTTVSVGAGQSSFTTSGTYSWTVPTDVFTISVVTVGAGGGGPSRGSGAGGGALAYVNHIPVTPGETLTVGVGTSGIGANRNANLLPTDGGNSYLKRGATSLVEAGGGKAGFNQTLDAPSVAGGAVIVGTGGSGGAGSPGDTGGIYTGASGGGAGGYSGPGGQGGGDNTSSSAGSGGGGGGGENFNSNGSGGGGVGIFGEGASGHVAGGGGSGGTAGEISPSISICGSGGSYGGGGGSGNNSGDLGGYGGSGAVRIIWGFGANRYFPLINTSDLSTNYTTVKAGISGLGTYISLEFNENIGITTTLTANVFAPYDPIYDEFAGVLYGPGQGTFMRQELNGNVIVYNEIDEITTII